MMNDTPAFHKTRTAWLLLAGSAFLLEAAALWFQYGMELEPCVMCIYERLAVVGLVAAGLIGLILPASAWLRGLGYLTWAASAGWGLLLALEHVGFQKDTTGMLNCAFLPNFPSWLPLEQWLPSLFMPTGYCDDIQWQWLSLTMPQWMIVIFTIYLVILAGVLFLEFRRRPAAV